MLKHFTVQEVGPDPEHMFNCHVIISSSGKIEAAYRKVHLFDVDVPNGPILMESKRTAPGQEVPLMLTFTSCTNQSLAVHTGQGKTKISNKFSRLSAGS